MFNYMTPLWLLYEHEVGQETKEDDEKRLKGKWMMKTPLSNLGEIKGQ